MNREETTMTKRQARTLMALGLTAILTQILCTAVLLRGLDRIRKEAAAQASAIAGLEMRMKLVEARWSTLTPESVTIQPAPLVVIDPWDGRTSVLTPVPHGNNCLRISSGESVTVFPPRHQGKE
jgi:hypothetical protein